MQMRRIFDKRMIAGAMVITFLLVWLSVKERQVEMSSDAQMWKEYIEANGVDDAYAQFAESVKGYDQGTQHSNAHAFGAALHSIKGPDGFPLCRDFFQYGCAHGFIAAALREEGMSAVSHFADICRGQGYPNMCLHGIGHGLVSSLGYDPDSFNKAVSACREMAKDTSTAGCVGGSVMEYGLKSMALEGTSLRDMTMENRYEPCTTIARDSKSACFFWLPGWWYFALTSVQDVPIPETIAQMGEACHGLEESEFIGQCFGGVGDIVSMASGYDAQSAVRLCELSSKDESERLFCKAFAADIFLGDARTQKEAAGVCGTVPQEERCMFMARVGVALFDPKK